jgi:polyisoprenoid-binding protein YceI
MKWNLDVTHSQAEFSVKHLMISTVRGRFKTLTGSGTSNDAGELTGATLEIDVASIDTNQQQRDDHLRSPDFFDVANHPKITFTSTKIVRDGSDIAITGDLTMKGVTKPVTLKGEYSSPVKDPWGNQRSALTVSAKINRKDWELGWNMALEAGGVVVSEEVKLSVEVEAVAVVEEAVLAGA